jgi:hypothetical protein
MAVIEESDKAVRLARAIASDISLYNEEKTKEGIQNDTFFNTLSAELEEGRELYRSRVSPRLDAGCYFYWEAIVNVIIRSKAHIKSRIW